MTEKINVEKLLSLPANLPLPRTHSTDTKMEIVTMTAEELAKAYEARNVVTETFQRLVCWGMDRWIALGYTLEHGYPIPPLMMAEMEDKKLSIIDGQQRTYSISKLISLYEAAIMESNKALESATEDAHKVIINDIIKKLTAKMEKIEKATIHIMKYSGYNSEERRYIYAACNNGKTPSGVDVGRAFIPEGGLAFVLLAQEKAVEVLPVNYAANFALYLWASAVVPYNKAAAGKQVFVEARDYVDSKENFDFPLFSEDYLPLVDAIGKRPEKSEYTLTRADFSKPGNLVPMIIGWRQSGKDSKVLAYAIAHLDELKIKKATIVVKKGKGKNGPVTEKVTISDVLSKSGSGNSLTLKKAQCWVAMLMLAEKLMGEAAKDEAKDANLSALISAVQEAEEGGE